MNSKFSHLRMKHNAHHMSTCTESACTYALFDITDNFFTHLWLDVSNCTLDFSLELKNQAWLLAYTLDFTNSHKKKSQGVRSQDLGGHWLSPHKDIIVLKIFCGVMQAFCVRCDHSRTCRGCRGGNCPPKFRRFGQN